MPKAAFGLEPDFPAFLSVGEVEEQLHERSYILGVERLFLQEVKSNFPGRTLQN